MRGTILGVHDGRGVLLGPNDQRLEFPMSEWRSAGTPMSGQIVDFVEEGGQAKSVFAVPGAAANAAGGASSSRVLGWIAIACLVVGFIIPFLPTIAAFVLGVIGAAQAKQEGDDTALLLSRIAWIAALVLLALGVLIVLVVIVLFGTLGFAGAWHGLGPVDF
jgi:hypothetical protein